MPDEILTLFHGIVLVRYSGTFLSIHPSARHRERIPPVNFSSAILSCALQCSLLNCRGVQLPLCSGGRMKKALRSLASTSVLVISFLQSSGTVKAVVTPRKTISLDTGWRFERQNTPGSGVEWQFDRAWEPGYDDSKWTEVFVPHTWDKSA